MNAENYQRFLKAIGHRVIVSSSGYWSDVARGFFESIPPSRIMTIEPMEINELFHQPGVIGLKFAAPENYIGKPSWMYICQDNNYSLKSLHPKMRNKVRQGLRNCTVQPISFENLHKQGMQLNLDTLKRQGRDDATFSKPANWARFCQAGQDCDGLCAWGSYVNNQLAAYMITFKMDGYLNILYQMSKSDLLKTRANNALAYVVTWEMLDSPDILGISYGQASIRELPGLEEFKVRLGYEKVPIRQVVVLHPILSTVLLNRAGVLLLNLLNRLFNGRDIMKRLNGTVAIARQSQGAQRSSEGITMLYGRRFGDDQK